MAATINLHVWTGTNADTDGGSAASFSFLSADSAADAAADRISNPITIPSSNCAYSYEKWLSACIGAAPSNNVSAFKVWGAFPAQAAPTGTCWLVGTAACASGATPVNTTSSVATSSLGGATSDAKYDWDTASYAAAACQTAYVVSQLQATTTACVGSWGPCDLNYSYDEV